MSTGISLHLEAFGHETVGVPVKVEVFDRTLAHRGSLWLAAKDVHKFELAPGLYGVRASLPSGAIFEQAVQVRPGELRDCRIPLYRLSPHESHEWAYLAHPIGSTGRERLTDPRYEGVWLRLWAWDRVGKEWRIIPMPVRSSSDTSWEEEGVGYRFHALDRKLFALQVGGPKVPWKCVALPPGEGVRVLVRPTSAPVGRAHPLDVVISSENVSAETLLVLMQRGDMSEAKEWVEHSDVAERLLGEKSLDPAAAAVGGYFLLRIRDIHRLHDWANNLANRFDWMPDGLVIHAWQLILEARGNPARITDRFEQAGARLVESLSRGFPIFTEGLRLLRDGLLLLSNGEHGAPGGIGESLFRVEEYMSASDRTTATTSFTGGQPDKPSTKLRRGRPRERTPLIYLYDVPVRETFRRGILEPGTILVAHLPGDGSGLRLTLQEDGSLELGDGRHFKSFSEMRRKLGNAVPSRLQDWSDPKTGRSLAQVIEPLRNDPGLADE